MLLLKHIYAHLILKGLKVKLSWTMSHWEEMLKNVFCIFDANSVDFYGINMKETSNKKKYKLFILR